MLCTAFPCLAFHFLSQLLIAFCLLILIRPSTLPSPGQAAYQDCPQCYQGCAIQCCICGSPQMFCACCPFPLLLPVALALCHCPADCPLLTMRCPLHSPTDWHCFKHLMAADCSKGCSLPSLPAQHVSQISLLSLHPSVMSLTLRGLFWRRAASQRRRKGRRKGEGVCAATGICMTNRGGKAAGVGGGLQLLACA